MWSRIENAIKHQIIADQLKEDARIEAAYGYYGDAAALEARGAIESAKAVSASINPFSGASKKPGKVRYVPTPQYYTPRPPPCVDYLATPALPALPPPQPQQLQLQLHLQPQLQSEPQPQPQQQVLVPSVYFAAAPAAAPAPQPMYSQQSVVAKPTQVVATYTQPAVSAGAAPVGYVYDYGASGYY
jgi:hypothetical protein